jgi:hypothetical protein
MAPPRGHFILRSNVMPPVTAGDYDLISEQSGTPFTVDTSRTAVLVSSSRYTMPPDQILSSFPPANAEGAFGDRLPQIVLKRRTLPWERNPFGNPEPVETPWLALVVVAEGEAELSREPRPVSECVTPGTVLRDPEDRDVEKGYGLSVTETVVRKIFPCQEDLALLTHVREVDVGDTELANGDDDGFLAVVLANRLPVFDAVTNTSVRYQACLVNLEGQLDELPPPSPPEPEFTFELAQDWSILATVTDDPDVWVSGGATTVNLAGVDIDLDAVRAARAVDVETFGARPYGGAALDGATGAVSSTARGVAGKATAASEWAVEATTNATATVAAAAADPDAAYAVRDAMKVGFHYPISIYAAERVLSFPVLAHWSFTTNEGATFETLMQDLDVGLLGTLPPPPEHVEGEPEPPPVPERSSVVATGHLALDHRTRRGDTSQAWYRGPCVPHPADREQPVVDEETGTAVLSVAHSADHLRRAVPDGLEDLSYSAAFEIGRLLALSQLSVTAALLRFRREQFGVARLRQIVEDSVPWVLDVGGVRDLHHLVSTMFIDQISHQPVAFAGPTRPVADPGRPIEGLGGLTGTKLDRFVADGFGIDLDALSKVSDAIGVVAALAETEVPVSQRDGIDDVTFAAMRDGLTTEVMRLAEMAMPDLRLRSAELDEADAGGTGRRRRRTPRPPDALDDLLARLEEEDEG